MTVRWTEVAAIGAGEADGVLASVGVAAGVVDVVAGALVVVPPDGAVAVSVFVDVAAGLGGAGFFASSGKIFGASQDQPTSTAMERTIAMKMRFSMVTGQGPNLQD